MRKNSIISNRKRLENLQVVSIGKSNELPDRFACHNGDLKSRETGGWIYNEKERPLTRGSFLFKGIQNDELVKGFGYTFPIL